MEYSTKELFDMYFATRAESSVKKIRGQIDRPEVYAYEEKIGKHLEDMDTQDIIGMMRTFKLSSDTEKNYKVSTRTYEIMLSLYRSFFDWYIDNIKIIKNPCNSKEIRGKVTELFTRDGKILTWNVLQELIDDIRFNSLPEVADYYECLIRACYEGFPRMLDLVTFKESDINHEKKTVIICGREVKISDRLHKLFVTINHMDTFPAHRGYYMMIDCDGSYFKFPTRERNIYDGKDPEYWASYLNRVFNREIKVKMGMNVNARMVYLLGFYDYIVKKCGKSEAERLVTAKRDSEAAEKLMGLADEYGIVQKNVTNLKQMLGQFIED